jgi:hypothetical protein
MFEITSPWPQILAELSPIIVAVMLGWELYRKNTERKVNEFKRLQLIELMRSDRIRRAGSSHLTKPAKAA